MDFLSNALNTGAGLYGQYVTANTAKDNAKAAQANAQAANAEAATSKAWVRWAWIGGGTLFGIGVLVVLVKMLSGKK